MSTTPPKSRSKRDKQPRRLVLDDIDDEDDNTKVDDIRTPLQATNVGSPPPSSTISGGASRFNVNNPRTAKEIESTRPIYRQHERPSETKEILKLREKATKPLSNSFSLLTVENSEDQLANTYDVTVRIGEFKKQLRIYDMVEVFQILVPDPIDGSQLKDVTFDLFTCYDSVTESQIRASNNYWNTYGMSYDLQNLDWTNSLMDASMEEDLRNKVNERIMLIPEREHGGPLTFFLALNEIISSTGDAVQSLVDKVTTMKIKDFPGEKIPTAVSQLQSAIQRLTFLKKLPMDLERKLLTTFQSTSVDEFNNIFNLLDLQEKLGQAYPTVDKILEIAGSAYRALVDQGKWNVSATGSSFNADKSGNNGCHECGSDTHQVRDCPVRKEKRNGTTTKVADTHWLKTPDPNGLETMTKYNATWYWCKLCHRWTKSHKTSEHRDDFRTGNVGGGDGGGGGASRFNKNTKINNSNNNDIGNANQASTVDETNEEEDDHRVTFERMTLDGLRK